MPNCINCGQNFEITDRDKDFYRRINVPDPAQCPECREQRRLTFRNEKNLYLRKCEGCGKMSVSIYSPDKGYHVWCAKCWWSDKWDPIDAGQDFDFSRPFFEQFDELIHKSKLICLFGKNNQNSDFVNQETDDKNCYLNAGGHYNEDCYYNIYSIWGKNNVDNYWIMRSELCYECVDCTGCFSSSFLQDCEICIDCHYCRDCKGCNNCFGCFGLRHKKFCFFNKALDEQTYKKVVKNYLSSCDGQEKALMEAQNHFLEYPHKAVRIIACDQKCTGDYLLNCKNVEECYLFEDTEDCKYGYIGLGVKDSYDLTSYGWGEVLYNVASSINDYNSISLSSTTDLKFSQYCFVCYNSSNLFGCAGLNQKQYCILNKQYSKEEYEKLLPRVIEHMRHTEEYGEFFPAAISPFCYNETVAQEYFPLTKEEALEKGYKWKDKDKREYQPQTCEIPDLIEDVPHKIIDEILACVQCGKNYKIIEPELKFYQKMQIPIPRKCPDCRHKRRLAIRNPRKLWDRKCGKCGAEIKTTYALDRKETVYCESCYQTVIY